ncbi:DUF1648 domain-containing protein [Flaviaesturariibacter flavus]|uniref:DUF1648 domain-containing protein n=1 Tax=Flaviaesturariibacter flavus TaxID=2502780 RepID=A0A4R1BNT1_9BACT|nr:DUF1648 domain-containing protein [Flaviaesturariibacter flavus]TCJ19068.1 DUF1648 domain-containing protein [Flaviaesturariibacter flavus]
MSRSARLLGWLSGGLLLFIWLMVIRSYGALPATIPIQFDAKGQATNWGPKASIWVLPVLASALYGLFSLLYHYADKLPQKPGHGDPQQNLALLRSLFLQVRLSVCLVMAAGIYYSIGAAFRRDNYEPGAMVPFIMVVILAPVVLFLFRLFASRKRDVSR